MKPHCCVCNKPVEEFVIVETDFGRQRKYLARCHGEIDGCEASASFLLAWAASDFRLERFEAFKPTEKLPEERKALPGVEERKA